MSSDYRKVDFFSCISEEDKERIAKIAEISLLIGFVRLEIENQGKYHVWAEKLLKAQEMVEDLL